MNRVNAQLAVILLLIIVSGLSAVVPHGEEGHLLVAPGAPQAEVNQDQGMATVAQANALKRGQILVVYNPECPHCHELLAYLSQHYPTAPITKTTDGSAARAPLQAAHVQWDGGVPLFIARLPEGNYVVIEGFPAAQQNVDGYIYGPKSEEAMCKQLKGTPIYIKDKYAFCKLPNGTIIGNEHAMDWVMEQLGIKKVM